jgi:ribosomal protein L9
LKKTKSENAVEDQEKVLVLDQLEKIIESGPNPLLSFHKVQIAKDNTKIFGSVSAADIQKELLDKYQVDIPKECFPDGFRLKQVGAHQIVTSIHNRKITFHIEIKSI